MDRNIQRLVRQQASAIKPKLTADDLFTSKEYASHIQSLVDTTTGRYSVPLKVELHHGGDDTACTTGNKIIANTHSDLIYHYKDLENKYMASIGLIMHECAHVLFLDFDAFKKAISMLENGLFHGSEPEPKTQSGLDALNDMKDAMAQKEYAPIFCSVYKDILNCVVDPHDEDALIAEYGGFVQKAILVTRESLFASATSIEDMEAMVQDGKTSKLSMVYGAILQYARFGQVIADDPVKAMKTETMEKLMEMAQDINLAQYTDDPIARSGYINRAMLSLWPWIKDELDRLQKQDNSQSNDAGSQNSQNGQGGQGGQNQQNGQGSQGQNGPPSEQSVQSILEQLKQGVNQSGATQMPEKRKSSKEAKDRSKQAQKAGGDGGQKRKSAAVSQPDPQDQEKPQALERLMSELAENMAQQEVQEGITRETCGEIYTVNQNSTHKGVPLKVVPQTDVTERDIQVYNEAMKDIAGYSKRLQRRMREALRDLKDGDIAHHKVSGNRFEARAAYRADEKYFANKKQPQDLPDMAIAVLGDHSGSMSGSRIGAVMKAAMLIYDFATNLDIPVCVSGHSTYGASVNFYTYTDFRQVRPSEKYRLAKMEAGGANRDGMAIQIAGNLLAKRPEDVKLLFIISDGRPNHAGYGGEEAAKDIQSIVRKLRKQGVEVIAAAIGDDKARIKEIYGEGSYLEIDDLAKLPTSLVRIVRKKILPN